MIECTGTDQDIDLDVEILRRAADILKTVGHPIRLRIVYCLESGERTVKEIQERIGRPQAITSQQLSKLKARGVLRSRREGTKVYYALSDDLIPHVLDCIRRCARERCTR